MAADAKQPDSGTDPAEALDALAQSFASEHHVPGFAYGLIRDGTPVHSGGVGVTSLGGARPGPDTVFRIASMTKSFTAAAVVQLRDAGALALDDPIGAHVPELSRLRTPSADSPPVTIRHLLTMSSGLAPDDPWADRHLDATAAELDAIFQDGVLFSTPPGTAFRYSNLGYAMLGRAVANITGASCQQTITSGLLTPLGLRQTGWTVPESSTEGVATGYVWRDDGWQEDGPVLGDGQIAPMGGLWSTVADLARWVAFLADAFPARDGTEDGPLCRASRREMQQIHRTITPSVAHHDDGSTEFTSGGYGFGLGVSDDQTLGRLVGHSGGLPGFGSHMAWLPDRGVGVIALANLRYARMRDFCVAALRLVHDRDDDLAPAASSAPMLVELAARLATLLNSWDDGLAGEILADNVAQDESAERRRVAARELSERLGPATVTDLVIEDCTSATFTLSGTRASAQVIFDLSPTRPPRIQFYEVVDN